MASIISAGTTSGTALNMAGDTSGVLQLATNGSTTAVTVTAAQNVGIGTASPSRTLSVYSTSSIPVQIESNQTDAKISLFTSSGSGGQGYIQASSGALLLGASNTERMRILSNGQVLIGATTSIDAILAVVGTAPNANAGLLRVQSNAALDSASCAASFVKTANDSTTSQIFIKFGINAYGSGSGQINANGANAAAFGSFSDIRLKENIENLPPQLANIIALRPVEFDFKTGGHQIGFIAQEMQEIYPDAVGEGADGMLTVTGWSKTEARLVKAIQEQQALITSLTARITALEGAA